MLIVEGPDGAGKTTLLTRMSHQLHLEVEPRVVTKDTEAMVDLRRWVDEDLDRGFGRRLYDRHRLISEPIYGPIMRETQEPGFNDLYWMAPRINRFYSLEPIIVYCLPPLATVVHNIMNDPDNSAVLKHIEQIYSAYVARISLDTVINPANTYIWDYTKWAPGDMPPWFSLVKSTLLETGNRDD